MGTGRDIDARKFARVAKQRLEEARTIRAKFQLYAAAEYLGGYAVECMLKALLLWETPAQERSVSGKNAIERLKQEFGHDLWSLMRALARKGARMSPEVARQFLFVSTWDPQSRYEPGPGNPDRTEQFLSAVAKVADWADRRM